MHITGYLRPSLNRIQRVKPGFIAKFLETNNNDSEKRKMSTRGGRVRAMDEASFFQSADEAEEGVAGELLPKDVHPEAEDNDEDRLEV